MLPVLVGPSDPVLRMLRAPGLWKRVLVGALIGIAAGVVWVVATPKSYQATVAIELTEASPQVSLTEDGPRGDDVSIDTDALIGSSDPVVESVAREVGQSPSQVREHLGISARPLTRVMTMTFTASTAGDAMRGAQRAAQTFLQERERLIVGPVRDYLTLVSDQQVAATRGAASVASEADLWSMELRRQAAVAKQVRLSGPGEIVEDARLTAVGYRGERAVPVATGAALGVLAVFAVGALRARRPGTRGSRSSRQPVRRS